MVTCPDCSGVKSVGGIGCGPGGCRPMLIECRTCRGMGRITLEQMLWITDGQTLRRLRMANDRSLREQAKALGMSPAEYSDAEHGRRNPLPLIERIVNAPATEGGPAPDANDAPSAPETGAVTDGMAPEAGGLAP